WSHHGVREVHDGSRPVRRGAHVPQGLRSLRGSVRAGWLRRDRPAQALLLRPARAASLRDRVLRTGTQRLLVVRAVARRRRAHQRRSSCATRGRGPGALRSTADRRGDRFRVDRVRRAAQSFDAGPVVLRRPTDGTLSMSLAIDIPARLAEIDRRKLRLDRLAKIRAELVALDYGAALLSDPMNIRYATDTHTFNVWTLHARVATSSCRSTVRSCC